MPSPEFNAERAAAILVDAEILGPRQAIERWKITSRTLERYRARLKKDPSLSALVRERTTILERADWTTELNHALSEHIRKHRMIAAAYSTPEDGNINPDEHAALTESTRVLAEIALGLEVLRAGNGHENDGITKASRPAQA